MYLLTNSFEKSVDGRSVYLEGNQLHCDCNTAKVLKVKIYIYIYDNSCDGIHSF